MLVQQFFLLLLVLLQYPLPGMRYLPLYALLESGKDGVPGQIFLGLGAGGLRHPIVVKGAAEGQSVVLEGKANPVLLFHINFRLKPAR